MAIVKSFWRAWMRALRRGVRVIGCVASMDGILVRNLAGVDLLSLLGSMAKGAFVREFLIL